MMNMKSTMSAFLVAASLVLGASRLLADEQGGHGHDHASGGAAADSQKTMSSHDGMTALYGHIGEIEKDLTGGKLDGIHEHVEGMEASMKDLDKDTTLTAAKKKRVQGYVKNLGKLAHKVHHLADDKKLEATRKEFEKLKAQVDLLDKQFAHSHKPGAGGKKEEGEHHQEAGK